VGSDSVFLDCLWVTRGCLGCWIHLPPLKAVSGAISEWAASHFSLTVYESTGAVVAGESIHHLWKQFQGRFLRGQRLGFSWLFMSQKGLCRLTNPFVTCERSFGGYFWLGAKSFFFDYLWVKRAVGADESICHLWKEFRGLLLSGQGLGFPWLFMSHQGLFGLPNPFATCESSFGGYIWMGSESFFLDYLWVNRGCGGWRIHSSHVKAVSGAISERARTQFFVTVFESKGAVWADESIRHLWKEFRGLLLSGQRLRFPWLFMSHQGLFELTNPLVTYERSFGGYFWLCSEFVFLDCLWDNRGRVGWRFHSSPVKRVSRATYEWAATQFSLTVYESTEAVCVDASIRHLWKEFLELFLTQQRVSFRWLFMS
jgi:hypothetical protein